MEMFSYDFMIRALIAASFMAIIAPLLGVFLVLRRQSLLADTLSHVSLAGIALGFLINLNPTITTLIVVVLSALVLEYIRKLYSSYSEVSTAVLMSGGLAVALILMNLNKGENTMNINQYLFGSIITINWAQVKMLGLLMVIILIVFVFLRRPMYVLTFDEETAHVDGLPVNLLSILFNVLTGVAITVMIPIAGALLVSAIIILPGTISMKLGKTFNQVIIVSIFVGFIGMISGLIGSYQLDTPPGATITLVFIVLFIVVNLYDSLRRRKKKTDIL
ncbi:metal ABC transporter permease [Vagococcus carniphilus]|uniref:metal ABC transporter permease n=1 Tax=Vagococcus carniphilus TaxID=218144 RepID=UPI0028918A2B|nr:metal ABC transporter permease [Vagococcus carniphilus]MDT2814906.1 metal ABC transporter permease [Vagococcus carniphilus]MDT2831754.1 metal ABC transporter permease [Vagococcus carniphilus]MDT2840607.1 metal ABC transporter permease [Vagococcus carniphilus]MDT2855265.1 metal ABC transporter permease [Vagococcus carniphilus]MDT2866176.1 metal ABC transporter permease [Vagococcus carniphilus]